VQAVSKRFGGVKAVNGVSLKVMRRARSFSLIGPNGAGKTTTFNLISGVLPSEARCASNAATSRGHGALHRQITPQRASAAPSRTWRCSSTARWWRTC
jgi:ABC-type branched-subunit amino acid transport system ATPase component